MAVTSFAEAAQRLRSGGDFFASCREARATTALEWHALPLFERGFFLTRRLQLGHERAHASAQPLGFPR